MGKGKRNRQFHYEDKQANPEKYREPKKPFRMPKWAFYTITSVVLVVLVGAIVLTSLFNNGVFLRMRILVNSQGQNDDYDLNQQMAAFIVWQNMYQQAYYEWYYTSWGLYTDTYGITKTYSTATEYAMTVAKYYSTVYLRDGLDSMSDYLAELVAGADAGVKAGLTLDENDQKSIDELLSWVENIQTSYASGTTLNNFLNYAVGNGVNKSDVEDAARLMAMYTKYCNYTKLNYDDDLDGETDHKTLLDFIAKNPSGHYEAAYRAFQAADAETAKRFEGVTNVEEFTALVIDILMEENYNGLIMDKFAEVDAEADEKKLTDAKSDTTELNNVLAELGITSTVYTKTKVTTDGKTSYTYSPAVNDTIKEWIFNSKRTTNGEFDIVSGEDSIYLIYIFEKVNTDESGNVTTVSAGWKEYKAADYSSEVEGFAEQLKKDLASEERKNSTEHKSAEDLAKAFYDTLKDGSATMPESAVTETVKKPSDSSTKTAIQKVLYADGVTIKVGDIYQADNSGTSYVFKVTKVDGTDYTISKVTYEDSDYYYFFRNLKSKMDSAYPLDDSTLSHPESTTSGMTSSKELYEKLLKDSSTKMDGETVATVNRPAEGATADAFQAILFADGAEVKVNDIHMIDENGTVTVFKVTEIVTNKDTNAVTGYKVSKVSFDTSFEEWMCEAEVKEATDTDITKREFARAENDVKWFQKTTTSSSSSSSSSTTTTTTYTAYIVVKPMECEQDDDATVYGGYLKFTTEADANAALEQLKGKDTFALWHAFNALSVDTTDSSGKTSTTSATLDTGLQKDDLSDEELQKWFFDEARKQNDLAVVKVSDTAYYLVYYKSATVEWVRDALDEWVSSEMTEQLEQLVSEGGYKLDESVLNKIGKPSAKTEESTAEEATA